MMGATLAILIATVCTPDYRCTATRSAPMFAEDCRRERDAILDGTDGGAPLRYNPRVTIECQGVLTYAL